MTDQQVFADGATEIHISAGGVRAASALSELWAYRELARRLLWRDIAVRYRQTVLGLAWTWIVPLVSMVIYSIFFGYLARFPSDDWPYPVFLLSGILVWSFMSRCMSDGAGVLLNNTSIISKIYFPRLLLPLNQVVVVFVDFIISLAVLVPVMVYFDIMPTPRILFLPAVVVLMVVFATGAAMWLSGLNARYRDVGAALPLALQVWMFTSPVFYSMSIVPERFVTYYKLNPMVGILQAFRWSLGLNANAPDGVMLASSILCSFILLFTGFMYFRRCERTIVDTA